MNSTSNNNEQNEQNEMNEINEGLVTIDDENVEYNDIFKNYHVPDESDYKHTVIDCLDEDTYPDNYNGPRFFVAQFVSPEGIMNCSLRAFKIKGCYKTIDEAKYAIEKFKKDNAYDKYFDMMIGEMGKWMAWDPSLDQLVKNNSDIIYGNKKLEKMMNKLHKSQLKTMNELVGRHKDNIHKGKVKHKNRMREQLHDTIDELDDAVQVVDDSNNKQKPRKTKITKKTHTAKSVQEKLLKKIKDRQNNNNNNNDTDNQQKTNTIENNKEIIKNETNRIIEKEEELKKLEKTKKEMDEKLERMKKLYNERKNK